MNESSFFGIRIESGSELSESIENEVRKLGQVFCDVVGFGELQWLELAGPEDGTTLRFPGPLTLLDLKYRIRQVGDVLIADRVCLVSRHTDNGIQVLGGKLIRAGVSFAELVFLPLATGELSAHRSLNDKETPDQDDAPIATGTNETGNDRWAGAIAESERIERQAKARGLSFNATDDDEDYIPRTGDIVNHRQFGRCVVSRIGDTHLTLRKPDGRNVQLGLPILKFIRTGTEGKKNVFEVEVRPR